MLIKNKTVDLRKHDNIVIGITTKITKLIKLINK